MHLFLLHCLTLDCVGAMPATYDLFHAYPNLYELTIREDSVLIEPSRMQGVRERNQQDQREYGSWDDMFWVTAPLPTLYMLGLRCTVDILHLTVMSELEANLLGPVLADTSPSFLTLTTSCERILDNQSILAALNRPGRQRECHALDLELKVRPSDSVEALRALWRRMKRELSDVQISRFVLCIDCDEISQEEDGADDGGNKQALTIYFPEPSTARFSVRRCNLFSVTHEH
ncbi:hypothetical protein C8Q74DRAFT_764225 [Fomes fomentarius]|nr:hypothetical protein C8Q74DRAFT_764225 [Fomes fomentarius]